MDLGKQSTTNKLLKWWRRSLITVSAVAAALASFTFLRDLALFVGWPMWAAVLLPLSLDALAAASLTEYRLFRSRTGAVVSVLAVVGSAAGNALSHLYSTEMAEPTAVPVIAVGVVPAITLWLIIHVFTPQKGTAAECTFSTDIRAGSADSCSNASGSVIPTSSPPPHLSVSGSAAGATIQAGKPQQPKSRSDSDLIAAIRKNEWQNLSGDKLASKLHISKTKALRLRKAARDQQNS